LWLTNLFVAGRSFSIDLTIDFLQGIGLTLNLYGVSKNAVLPSNGCNAQGFFINIGDVSSAWWTLVITLHTFLVIAGGPNIRGWVTTKSETGKARWVLVFVLWFGVFFLSTVGMFLIQNIDPQNGPFCIISSLIELI
jgi:G protein-coupled glucose receptor regulating Gpa2